MMQVRYLPMEQLGELLGEQLAHGCAHLPVTGSSMLPMLRGGRDTVKLAPANVPLPEGEVILYRRENGQYVLHRLIRMVDAETCLCCGDNQWQGELLPARRVIARVVAFQRAGKWYDTNKSKGYRLYRKIWTALFPVRRPVLAVRRILGRARRILRRDVK